jgi:hypothetical protein
MSDELKEKVASLFVIRGHISGIKRTQRRINELTDNEQAGAAGAAIGAAMAGNAAGAVGGMQTVGYRGHDVEFFNFQLGNFSLHGHFNIANFKNGDEIEAVVTAPSPGSSVCEAVAIARPKDQILWTRGNGKGYKLERKNRILFLTAFIAAIYVIFIIVGLFKGKLLSLPWQFYAATVIFSFLFGVMLYFTQPRAHKEAFALERRALFLLGFENPDWVNISKYEAFKDPFDKSGMEIMAHGAYRYDSVKISDHAVVDAHSVISSDI